MTSPLHRSPRLALSAILVAAAAVACSDGATSTGSYHGGHLGSGNGSTGSPDGTGSASDGNGGSTNGATAGNTGNAGNGGSTGNTSSTGETGNTGSTGNTGGNTGNTGNTGSNTGNTGSNTGGTTGGTTNAAFDVLLDNASPVLNLADEATVQVTVAPQSFTGNVALSVSGLPADVTATFDQATVAVSGTTGATAKLSLKSLSSSAPGALALKVVGTAGTSTKETAFTPTVKSVITIKIPVNVDANTGPNVFGTINIKAPLDIANNPVVVNFLNLDSTPHEIHAGNPAQGFPHGSSTFGQNKMDKPRNVIATGSYKFYLHDEGSAKTPGTIVIQ